VQTSNAMALALGAPPTAAIAQRVANNLADDVRRFGNKTTCGVTGLAWLMPQLEKYGHGELALAVLEGDQYPSLGHMAAQNMTTLCENWACTAHDAGGGSLNHIMLGGFDPFLHNSVGGLDSIINGTTAGWKKIRVRVSPAAITRLRSTSYDRDTRFGRVSLNWGFHDDRELTMRVRIPVGATAFVHSPLALHDRDRRPIALRSVKEGGATVWQSSTNYTAPSQAMLMPTGVHEIQSQEDALVAKVGSGEYLFTAVYA
jgi:alpha-L-rhamnosidase